MKAYSKTRFQALQDAADGARGAATAAEIKRDDARKVRVGAQDYVNKLGTGGNASEGQLEAALRALSDAKSEEARHQAAYDAASARWSAAASLVARATDFIRENRLQPAR